MIPDGFVRVSARNPCPICKKRDWCLVHKTGSSAICPRVPSQYACGEAGYWHRISEDAVSYRPTTKPNIPPKIDATVICHRYQMEMRLSDYTQLSKSLGLTALSLNSIGVGRATHYCEGTYSFPMRDDKDQIIGVRLRNSDGHKWAVYGSRSGLFYGTLEPDHPVYICEGPTDTCAMLDLGFVAIGKPSCSSGNELILGILRKLTPPLVVVVSDVDSKGLSCDHCGAQYCAFCRPGQFGANKTAAAIHKAGFVVKVIEPVRAKDVREWVNKGATRASVLAVTSNTPCFLPE